VLHSPRRVPTSKMCSRSRSRAVGGLLLMLLLSLLPQLAWAKSRKPAAKAGDAEAATSKSRDCLQIEECRQIFESARRLSDSRQYNAALTGYEKAFAMSTSPWLLINIGRVQQKLGRPADAITSFKRFLDDAGQQPAEAVSAAREYLQQAESDLAAQREKDRLAAQPATATTATTAIDTTAPKTEKPVYKKWWFWLALGGAAAAVATAVAVGVTVGTAGASEPPRAPFHIAF
jgi:tetratricopeptide (TPR) repeat protein